MCHGQNMVCWVWPSHPHSELGTVNVDIGIQEPQLALNATARFRTCEKSRTAHQNQGMTAWQWTSVTTLPPSCGVERNDLNSSMSLHGTEADLIFFSLLMFDVLGQIYTYIHTHITQHYITLHYITIQYNAIQYNTKQNKTIQYIQYNTYNTYIT